MLLSQQRSSAECLLSVGGLEGNLQNSEQIFTENITQPSSDEKHDNQKNADQGTFDGPRTRIVASNFVWSSVWSVAITFGHESLFNYKCIQHVVITSVERIIGRRK